jgi:hypothetical protein
LAAAKPANLFVGKSVFLTATMYSCHPTIRQTHFLSNAVAPGMRILSRYFIKKSSFLQWSNFRALPLFKIEATTQPSYVCICTLAGIDLTIHNSTRRRRFH